MADSQGQADRCAPVPGILAQARKLRARVIVLGSRGLGAVGRLLLGSVSRAVVRRAPCSMLVVRGSARAPRRFLIGLDGSPNARRAVTFVAGFARPRGGEVRLLRVVEPVRLPSTGLLPSRIRGAVADEAARHERERVAAARRHVEPAGARLAQAGWRVRVEVRIGRPLEELLAATSSADVLVVGARGVGGVERLLLGSVAEGVITRSPVPVLAVR
jgi:nucleotide-binding universal stress UspA family protein